MFEIRNQTFHSWNFPPWSLRLHWRSGARLRGRWYGGGGAGAECGHQYFIAPHFSLHLNWSPLPPRVAGCMNYSPKKMFVFPGVCFFITYFPHAPLRGIYWISGRQIIYKQEFQWNDSAPIDYLLFLVSRLNFSVFI